MDVRLQCVILIMYDLSYKDYNHPTVEGASIYVCFTEPLHTDHK